MALNNGVEIKSNKVFNNFNKDLKSVPNTGLLDQSYQVQADSSLNNLGTTISGEYMMCLSTNGERA